VLSSVSACLKEFRNMDGDISAIKACGISNQRETFVVWDEKGKKYLDFFSGLAVSGIGHTLPVVVSVGVVLVVPAAVSVAPPASDGCSTRRSAPKSRG